MNIFKWFELEFRSLYMRRMLSFETQQKNSLKREKKRQKEHRPHTVYYFHEVSDPYSHLCTQTLKPLTDNYEIDLIPLIVGEPPKSSTPEAELLIQHGIQDATMIAPYYNLQFNPLTSELDKRSIKMAQSILVNCDQSKFIKTATQVGEALWSENYDELCSMNDSNNHINNIHLSSVIKKNNLTRKKMGHYFGGVFAYEGECYWGIDRLPHLERRLTEVGAKKENKEQFLIPRKSAVVNKKQSPQLYLDIFWSGRSPYSYLAMKPLAELREQYNVKLRYQIILPMVMRGMKINPEKGLYIIKDCMRVADENNIPFGKIIDPLGEAVERCYSMFDYARKNNKEEQYLHAFAKAVWAEGKHGYLTSTLKTVIHQIDLDWEEAKTELDSTNWTNETDKNRETLYKLGKWGPPTMTLSNAIGENLITVWGQDRIWLIEETIKLMQVNNN
tara:strand:- start:830 stop:2164 length:1335 start_codon:yes stop_codon:yes gene_type:complete